MHWSFPGFIWGQQVFLGFRDCNLSVWKGEGIPSPAPIPSSNVKGG